MRTVTMEVCNTTTFFMFLPLLLWIGKSSSAMQGMSTTSPVESTTQKQSLNTTGLGQIFKATKIKFRTTPSQTMKSQVTYAPKSNIVLKPVNHSKPHKIKFQRFGHHHRPWHQENIKIKTLEEFNLTLGLLIAAVAVLVLVAALWIYVRRKHKKANGNSSERGHNDIPMRQLYTDKTASKQ